LEEARAHGHLGEAEGRCARLRDRLTGVDSEEIISTHIEDSGNFSFFGRWIDAGSRRPDINVWSNGMMTP
jgi:hypothetical protein